jgi:hypothetical protein
MKKNDSKMPSPSQEADKMVEILREAYTCVEELRQGDAHRRILQKAAGKIKAAEDQTASREHS